MKFILALTVLIIATSSVRATDATAATAPPPKPPILSHVRTNCVKVTCPLCKTVSEVPGKCLQTSGSNVTDGGSILTLSASVKCKCGEMLSVNVPAFMPTPKTEIVASSKAECKPVAKLSAPKDLP